MYLNLDLLYNTSDYYKIEWYYIDNFPNENYYFIYNKFTKKALSKPKNCNNYYILDYMKNRFFIVENYILKTILRYKTCCVVEDETKNFGKCYSEPIALSLCIKVNLDDKILNEHVSKLNQKLFSLIN